MTDKPAEVVLDAIAVYRLVRLLQQDTLPPLPAVREKLMDRYGAHPLSELIDCPWCLSIWVGAGAVVARRFTPRLWGALARVLASSAVTGLLSALHHHVTQKPEPALQVVREGD